MLKPSGPFIHYDCYLHKKRKETDSNKQGRRPREGRGRVWGDTKEHQGLRATLEAKRKAWSRFYPRALWVRARLCLHLNFRQLASRNVKGSSSVVKSHLVCAALLRQPWELQRGPKCLPALLGGFCFIDQSLSFLWNEACAVVSLMPPHLLASRSSVILRF